MIDIFALTDLHPGRTVRPMPGITHPECIDHAKRYLVYTHPTGCFVIVCANNECHPLVQDPDTGKVAGWVLAKEDIN